jgi:hypothetical protein
MMRYLENKVGVGDDEQYSEGANDRSPLLFPNPNDGNFKIMIDGSEILGVEVTNYIGEIVYQNSLDVQHLEEVGPVYISIPYVCKGLFYVKIITNHGNYYDKFIKE